MAERNNPSVDQDQLSAKLLKLLSELNPQQFAFFESYFSRQSPAFGNATKASELARYAGEPGSVQLSVTGHRLLNNPKIRRCMEAAFEQAGCTLELDAKVIFEAMTATRTRYLCGPDNTIISTPPEPDHPARLRGLDMKYRLLRTTATVTHQRLPAADSDTAPSGEHDLCASCGEAMSKVAALNPADRALLLDITKFDEELRSADTPQENAGEEHGELDAPGKNSC
jgi:hypothetical protein